MFVWRQFWRLQQDSGRMKLESLTCFRQELRIFRFSPQSSSISAVGLAIAVGDSPGLRVWLGQSSQLLLQVGLRWMSMSLYLVQLITDRMRLYDCFVSWGQEPRPLQLRKRRNVVAVESCSSWPRCASVPSSIMHYDAVWLMLSSRMHGARASLGKPQGQA